VARRYYYPGGEKHILERLRNRIFRKPVPDFPKTVVIETQSGCNASCVFCSYTRLKDKLPRGRMSNADFEKIAAGCAGRAVERFILCLDNEPLLDNSLAEKFALLKKYCPAAVRNLTTNGSLLTPGRVEELLGGLLVNEVFLSINGVSREVYEKSMGLSYEKVMGHLAHFCQWLRAHPGIKKQVRVRVNTVRTQLVAPELPALKKRWKMEGFEVHVIDLDNRGAQVDGRNLRSEKWRPFTSCRRPFHTMVLTWEGQALLCCVDYQRSIKLGNLHEQSLYEIWNGPRATQLRRDYLARRFKHLPICATCKVGA